MSTIAVGVLLLACGVLLCLVVSYERELRALARFLERRDPGGNERASVQFTTPAIADVAYAVNVELDARRDERVAEEARRAAFQQDLAALSHDIRTPLAGAQGYLQLHDRADDPAERRRCLAEAQARLAAMRELTDQLFEYAKAADPDRPLTVEKVELFPLVASALAEMYPAFVGRSWEPSVDFEDEGARVQAEPDALRRVVANLLANSLRHGAAAPRVTQRGRRLAVSNRVEDPASVDPDRLFERFYQADPSRSHGGSGLGLAIVERLCTRMGATVRARLEDGELTVEVEFAG